MSTFFFRTRTSRYQTSGESLMSNSMYTFSDFTSPYRSILITYFNFGSYSVWPFIRWTSAQSSWCLKVFMSFFLFFLYILFNIKLLVVQAWSMNTFKGVLLVENTLLVMLKFSSATTAVQFYEICCLFFLFIHCLINDNRICFFSICKKQYS